MKLFCAAAFIFCLQFVQPAFAQYGGSPVTIGKSLSFGFEGNGSFAKQFDGTQQYAPYQIGLGFVSRYEHPFYNMESNLNFTATTGVTAFLSDQTVRHILGRPNTYTERVYYFIPVKAGLKYYWGENFYVEGEAGGIVNASNSFKTTLTYAPGIGVAVPFGQGALDLGLRYEAYNQTDVFGELFLKSFLSLRLVYKIDLGN
ncbi:hypothetical protein KXQ82_07830 [Mucilaginibacter sp. HMF5004]|uniref:hypothetical protein n=1 Tax=Mucilaginibacter rivuli TaxID=2857527 RepID=UPI001C6062C9|nr:hypothetical protein [Mucilaginibacter rivuli]MBW4889620.1 hypothetical protein [Mucilaginibacter rivuli]